MNLVVESRRGEIFDADNSQMSGRGANSGPGASMRSTDVKNNTRGLRQPTN